MRRAAATVSEPARPTHGRTAHAASATPVIHQRRELLPSVEPYRPTAFATHVLRRHLRRCLRDARFEMRAILAGECLAAGSGQAALRIFLGGSARSRFGRFLFRGLLPGLFGGTFASGLLGSLLAGLLGSFLFLRLRCYAHIVHEVGVRTAGSLRTLLRSRFLRRRQMFGFLSRALARVRAFPGSACCFCHATPTPEPARVSSFSLSSFLPAAAPSNAASHRATGRRRCPRAAGAGCPAVGRRAAAW